jgi:hypothetical protein
MLGNPGEPWLPVRLCRVVIPADAEPTGVELLSEHRAEVPGAYRIYPAQIPRPVSANFDPGFTPPDAKAYGSVSNWPGTVVELTGSGCKAGFRIAEVMVHPVQYQPASGRLEFCEEVRFRLDYRVVGHGALATGRQRSMAMQTLSRLVVNPEDLERFGPSLALHDSQDVDHVIVTSSALAAGFEPLLDWYRQTGLKVETRTREWIVASYPGSDVPERIRNFIIDYYENHGLTSVLLAGDTQVIPCRKARATAPPYTDDLPCDLYYSDLQWSWDGDHDGIWGEYGDDTVDFYSDVAVGRAPVDDTAQARGFVNKVLSYELNPAPGYVRKVLLPYTALYSFYPARLAQDSIAAFIPPDWQTSVFTGMTTTAPIRDSVESGFGLVHAVAHGNNTGLYTMSSAAIYNVAAANSQSNCRKLPVFTSIACLSGNFEYDECLAEALINNPNGGAVAAAMNSRYGIAMPPGTGPSEQLDVRFFEYLLSFDSTTLGLTHSASKDYYAELGRSGGVWQWCLYELNLFGDPLLPVWTAEPAPLLADYPKVLNPGSQQLPLRITRYGRAEPGASVRVYKDADFNASGTAGPDGRVVLNIAPQTSGAFRVIARARNAVPFRDSGQVRTSGAYVHAQRYWFSDSVAGNLDGVIGPGETAGMAAWVTNFGNLQANALSARLVSRDPNIAILDSVRNAGTLAPRESAQVAGFRLAVAPACTNGYLARLDLVLRDAQDSAWTSVLQLPVGASRLAVAAWQVNDSPPGGNGDARLDPGETGQLIVLLANRGFGHAYSVSAILRSANGLLLVQDSLASFGTIPSDSAAANVQDRFQVRADSQIPREAEVRCSLFVRPAGEPEQRLSLILPVGQIRTTDPIPDTGGTSPRYFAYDDTDTGYVQCPAFDWVEMRDRGTNLNLTDNQTVQVSLPFTFRFYGSAFRTVSVCSNGWLCFGSTTARRWVNLQMPDGQVPHNMVCPNWDDLDPEVAGAVWVGFDTIHGRFVVEWDSVAYHDTTGARDKFEVLLYDSTRVTPTLDNELVFQYQTANYYGSSSIGIENSSSAVGIGYLFDSLYHRAAATIMPGRAIRFTTRSPSAVTERESVSSPVGFWLDVVPTLGPSFSFECRLAGPENAELAVFDLAGRAVYRRRVGPGSGEFVWDGGRGVGRPVPAGVYFCVLRSRGEEVVRKVVRSE